MYVLDSSIINNTARESGGGIFNANGDLFLTNTTVSGNVADSGGGTFVSSGGGIHNFANAVNPGVRLTLTNSTISNNRSTGAGGGLRNDEKGLVRIANTIIGDNFADADGPDVSGSVVSSGFNLVESSANSTGWVATDLLNLLPNLAPLGNNGGSTLTHALIANSPAKNAGLNALATNPLTGSNLLTDQRGYARRIGVVDIGAYESNIGTSPVNLSGRVLTATGLGTGLARLSLTDSSGNVRYAHTNPFGHYRFLGLPPGETFSMAVSHKQLLFESPQIVTVDENRDDLVFIALN